MLLKKPLPTLLLTFSVLYSVLCSMVRKTACRRTLFKKAAAAGLLAVLGNICFYAPVSAQVSSINNHHSVSGGDQGYYTSSTDYRNGSPASWVADQYWWGLSASNNVISHLNTNPTGGSVVVSNLSNAWNGSFWYYTNGNGSTTTQNFGPTYNVADHTYTGSGTVTITSGTTQLRTNVDPAGVTSYGTGAVFSIGGVTKAGGGTLSLEINKLNVTNFTGNANGGTLQLATSTANALQTGTLTTTNASLQGGDGSGGGANNAGATSTFNFTSGTANNAWTIANLDGQGFNNSGIINVTNAGTTVLNRTTTVNTGTIAGQLNIAGATTVGNDAGNSILNINAGGLLDSAGLFTAGTNAGSRVNINVNGANAKLNTHTNTILSSGGTDSEVIAWVGGNGLWNNTGTMTVGRSGKATLLAQSGGTVQTTGDYIIADIGGSVATGGSDGGTTTITGNLYAGNGGDGTLQATSGGTVTVQTGEAVFGVDTGSIGRGDIDGSGSKLNVQTGDLTVARSGDGSYVNITNGGLLDVQTGNGIIGENAGVTGTINVETGSELKIKQDLITGKAGTGLLYVNSGGAVTVGGNHIIADDLGSFGRDHIDGNGSTLDITGGTIVGNDGQAGGKYDYDTQGRNGNNTDPTVWLGSDNTTLTPLDGAAWNAIKNNAPGLAITDGGIVNTTENAVVGKNPNGYGYVVVDNKGSAADRAAWKVDQNMTAADAGEAYVRIINGGLMGVAQDMTVANQGGAIGTVRLNGVDTLGNTAELQVTGDLTVAKAGNAKGNLYASEQAAVNVGNDLTIAEATGSYGRAHFDGENTTVNVERTLTVGQSGQAGQSYQYLPNLPGGNKANDPAAWFDSNQTLDDLTTVTAQNNMPGLLISDGAVVKSGQGMVAENAGSVGYVVIDNKGSAATRSEWNVIGGDLTVAKEGTAYTRVLNGALLNVSNGNLTVADEDGSRGTLRVQDAGSELKVSGDFVVADKTGSTGDFYLHDAAKAIVSDSHYIAWEAGSYGRDHIDGSGTELNVAGELMVGVSGQAGQKFIYVPGQDDYPGQNYNGISDSDPEHWFDSNQTLDDIKTGLADQNNMPGLAITAGAAVSSGSGAAAVQTGSNAYIVIDGKDRTGTNQSQWVNDGNMILAHQGTAYVRVLNGALLQSGSSANDTMIIGNDDGSVGTVRVSGVDLQDNTIRSELNVTENLITANGGGGGMAKGNLYVHAGAKATVDGNHIIADGENSTGRDHIDGSGTTMDVTGKLTVSNAGQAGQKYIYKSKYEENGNKYDGTSPADPLHWFDSAQTLDDIETTTMPQKNMPGLAITAGAAVSSGSGAAAVLPGSNAYIVIDGKDRTGNNQSQWVNKNDMTLADKGTAYVRVLNGALLQSGSSPADTMIIGNDSGSVGTVRVSGVDLNNSAIRSELNVTGDLITAKGGAAGTAKGNLYVHAGAKATVAGDHTIADGANTVGRDHIDGEGTTLEVTGTLTVGKSGQAGGTYTENRYDSRYQDDPARWFDSSNTLVDLQNPSYAKTGHLTGNAPGLAITAGAKVSSGYGMVGENAGSNGYVLIDTKDQMTPQVGRSEWNVKNDLSIAKDGNAFVRVLNGSLLKVDGNTKLNSTGGTTAESHGTLHVIGNGAATDAGGKLIYKEDNNFPTDKFSDGDYARYTALEPYGYRTEWITQGATVLGDVAAGQTEAGRGTIRINDGGYGETRGLYVGLKAGSFGEVSVQGAASELHILEDTGSGFQGSEPEGSSLLSVSDNAFLQLHTNAVLEINGNGMFSNDSILHLDPGSRLDAMNDRISFVGARIEGIGTVTGDKGVVFMQDGTYSEGTAIIDPGLAYGWNSRDEDPRYYGTLTFGDQLLMSGDVITNFDINSGYFEPDPPGSVPAKQDGIVVKRGDDSHSTADIYAELSGTLNVHARLTDFYEKERSFIAVHTEGDDKSGEFVPGRIIGLYDTLRVVPSRFFDKIGQEIREDGNGNDDLYVSMIRKDDPFESAGKTYNERQTGKGLDNIYEIARNNKDNGGRDWLPLLRYFWYLEDPEFLNAYRLFSGEVRAHSLLLPMQDLWIYANNQMEFRQCDCHNTIDACEMAEMANDMSNLTCSVWKKRLKRFVKDGRVWGNIIYQNNDTDSDGNAGSYNIRRTGGVVGFDRPVFGPNTYLGIQFAFADSELKAYRSKAEADDFSFGVYHGTKIQDIYEWKNYIGMGIQDYTMQRSLDLKLTDLVWNPNTNIYDNIERDLGGHTLNSAFAGYTFSASTEFARPFYFGKCQQWMVRPYVGLDLQSVWQNSASETPGAEGTELVTLDYHSTSNVRMYGRPGITVERNGLQTNFRAGLAYSFLMGGRRYTNVNNKFQFGDRFYPGSQEFNIRGVDDGTGFLTLNVGSGMFLGKRKLTSVMVDYSAYMGSHSTIQAVQLGFQKRF